MRAGKAFYCMSEIGDYTFARRRVVWPNIASDLAASVIGEADGKPVIPQHTLTLVGCDGEDEAHYVCSAINSSAARFAARAYSQEGGKSFGDPHILDHIRIPKFDPKNKVHTRLAELSMQAHELARTPAGSEPSAVSRKLSAVEAEVDIESAKLWNLSASDLAEIQRSLKELTD